MSDRAPGRVGRAASRAVVAASLLAVSLLGWSPAGATETPVAVTEPDALVLRAVTCASWADVPANLPPVEPFDDTNGAWQSWGPPGDDPAGRCEAVAGVQFRLSATSGGGALDEGTLGFVQPGREDGVTTTVVSPTGADGSATVPMASLTPTQQLALAGPEGLWVSAAGLPDTFASLRCRGDRLYADNLEVLRGVPSVDAMTCVAYTVAPRTLPVPSPTPIETLPVLPEAPAPDVAGPIETPRNNVALPVAPEAPSPVVVVPASPADEQKVPASEPGGVDPAPRPVPVTPNLPGQPTTVGGIATEPLLPRRTSTVVVFLEISGPPITAGPGWSEPVAVEIDCGPYGTRRIEANVVAGRTVFTAAAPIEVADSTRCGLRPVTNLPDRAGMQPQLTVLGEQLAANEFVSLPAGLGEQNIVPVRLTFAASTEAEPSATAVESATVSGPRQHDGSALALPPSASVALSVDPRPLAATTQLILGAGFGLGLVLALLAARRPFAA